MEKVAGEIFNAVKGKNVERRLSIGDRSEGRAMYKGHEKIKFGRHVFTTGS
jgi:hypothetical protein